MNIQHWFLPTEIDMGLIERLACEAVESGSDPDSISVYMSPDIAQKLNEMFIAVTRGTHSYAMPQIMKFQSSIGALDFKVCPKMRCFMMVGTPNDYNIFTNNGIPLDFLSDQAHRELYEAIETTVLAPDKD